jgi:hypothetical protein
MPLNIFALWMKMGILGFQIKNETIHTEKKDLFGLILYITLLLSRVILKKSQITFHSNPVFMHHSNNVDYLSNNMKKTLGVLLMLLGFSSCIQKIPESTERKTGVVETPQEVSRTYTGKIDKNGGWVVIRISHQGTITGTYYGRKTYAQSTIKGSARAEGNIIFHALDSNNRQLGFFTGCFSKDNKIQGHWKENEKEAGMRFSLQESPLSFERSKQKIKDAIYASLTGRYDSELNSGGVSYASVLIKYIGKDAFSFNITTAHKEGCTGEIEGMGSLYENGVGHYSGPSCQALSFTFSPNWVSIDEENCAYHGMRCFFDGLYRR